MSPHIADGYSVHDTPILGTIEKQNDVFRSISYGIDENTICKVGNNALYFFCDCITGQMKGALPTEQFTRVRVKRIFSNRLP